MDFPNMGDSRMMEGHCLTTSLLGSNHIVPNYLYHLGLSAQFLIV